MLILCRNRRTVFWSLSHIAPGSALLDGQEQLGEIPVATYIGGGDLLETEL